jgi:hypothetical protein
MIARPILITLLLVAFAPLVAFAQVDAGEDVVLECASEDGTEYTLNGMVPEDDSVVIEWTTVPEVDLDDADTVTPTGVFRLGVTTATLTATVGAGTPESDSATVTVEDTQPPVVRVRAEPRYLWPPNHELREVEIRVRVRDACGDEDDVEVELIEAKSNEPDNGSGDGNTVNDIQGADLGTDDRSVLLRAERAGNGDGRVYTLTYRVTDAAGNQTDAEAKVYVPHDASDLRQMMDDHDDMDDMEPICRRPEEAVEAVVDLFPGLGSVRNARACLNVCKVWTRSCTQIASGSGRCVNGETKARALIEAAECKDSDDREEIRECLGEVKGDLKVARAELKAETLEAHERCTHTGRRCANACDDFFGDEVTTPVEDD